MEASSNRISAIDFTKGALVLLMVVYHVLNYLQFDSLPHDYLGFLPASFIMITGFLVAHVYLLNIGGRSIRSAGPRLATRALKLLLLFTVLNLAAQLLWRTDRYGVEMGVQAFLRKWFNVYVTGDARGVAFDVLVPISYTMLLAIPILSIQATKPRFLTLLAIAAFALCAAIGAYGWTINNLNLISAGFVGMWLGTRSGGSAVRVPGSWLLVGILAALYSCIVAFGPDNYSSQIVVTFLALVMLYAIGGLVQSDGWWFRQVCLLGRYSLVSYIVQILYLQGTRSFDSLWQGHPNRVAFTLIASISLLTWMTVIAFEYGRARVRAVDRLYSIVFG